MPGLFDSNPNVLSARDSALVAAYERAGRTLDDLPYTKEFTRLMDEVRQHEPHALQGEIFRRLHTLRKAGKLPKLGRGQSVPPVIKPEEEEVLAALVVSACGTLGQRDRLVYSPEFERLVLEFNQRTQRDLIPHDVWRLVAKIAK